MCANLTEVDGLRELDDMLAASTERPLLLFKHSRACGTSAEALDELLAHLEDSRHDARYAMVTVQTHREVSNAVATQLGIRHETPQALLIRGGRVVWSASHFKVTSDAIRKAIADATPALTVPEGSGRPLT